MKRQLKDLKTFYFKSYRGDTVTLDEFLDKDDFYKKTKGRNREVVGLFLKHPAIQRLAVEAGVKMSQPEMLVTPTASNEQQHLFVATFTGGSIHKGDFGPADQGLYADEKNRPKEPIAALFHDARDTIEVGEASTRNTALGVSRNYMGTMGFKRLFDRGVLSHLGFYELYSEEEADDFNEEQVEAKLTNDELSGLATYLDGFANAKSVNELDIVLKEAISNRDKLTAPQRNYLRVTYKKNLVDLELRADEPTSSATATKPPSETIETVSAPGPESTILKKKRELDAKLEAEAQKSAETVATAGEAKLDVPFE